LALDLYFIVLDGNARRDKHLEIQTLRETSWTLSIRF
jgi:hypothetical protein